MIVRSLSAVGLAPLLILLLLAGSHMLLFFLLMLVAPMLLWEWVRMKEPVTPVVFVLITTGVWLLLLTGFFGHADWIVLEIVGVLLALMVWGLVEYQPGKAVFGLFGYRFVGIVYCGVPLVLLDEIRGMAQGGALICLLLFVIWATDTGAYLVGRRWGDRKIAPLISPNKTWAGFWGGICLGTLAGVGSSVGFSLPFSLLEGVILGFVLSLSGQVGDLVESLLKRESGVKDSGQLIPGHGGLLDRLDSLLFAAPVFACYLRF